jgi:hypothetical protein
VRGLQKWTWSSKNVLELLVGLKMNGVARSPTSAQSGYILASSTPAADLKTLTINRDNYAQTVLLHDNSNIGTYILCHRMHPQPCSFVESCSARHSSELDRAFGWPASLPIQQRCLLVRRAIQWHGSSLIEAPLTEPLPRRRGRGTWPSIVDRHRWQTLLTNIVSRLVLVDRLIYRR